MSERDLEALILPLTSSMSRHPEGELREREGSGGREGSARPDPLGRQGSPQDDTKEADAWEHPHQRLSRAAAHLAGRLAALLRQGLSEDGAEASGPLARGCAFLDTVAAGAASSHDEPPVPHPLDRLAGGLGLSDIEVDLLLLAGLPEEHEGFAEVLRMIHPQSLPQPTAGLAAQLFAGSDAGARHGLRALLETGPAVRAGAVRLQGDGPFFSRSLLLAEALWPALGGIDAWPAAVRRLRDVAVPEGLEAWLESEDVRQASAALDRGAAFTLLLTAEEEETAFQRALALVHTAGWTAAGISFPAAADEGLESLIALHCLARGAVPVLRLSSPDGPGNAVVPALAGYPGPVVAAGRAGTAVVRGPRPVLAVACERLDPLALRRMWSSALPAFPDLAAQAPVLAARYPVEPATARRVDADLRLVAELTGSAPDLDAVAASVRARSGGGGSGGVRLVRPVASWADLVLPAERLAQLREAVDRLLLQARVLEEWGFLAGRPGARGVRMLLAGPPGTGKTLSAEVMAHTLGVDLLVVDLSRVVSKWIGETEKNLAEVFAGAESARAVLLFDEADALFGKRTEVSDAHDRYANLETAYLLARLERFEGLAILSSNLRQNIDPAFVRRLEFVVDVQEPGRDERRAIWECHLPSGAPLAPEVDLDELAGLYAVTGGTIRNAAVAAAFLAAADGGPITRFHFLRAIRREYEKSGKAFPGMPAGTSDAHRKDRLP